MGTSRELVRLFAELLNKELVDLGTSGLLSHLPQDLGHLACNLGGTRKDDRAVTGLEDTGMLMDSPTELPGPASSRTFLCCSMEKIFLPLRFDGTNPTWSPGRRVPCSTVPQII